jgi:hypothetical protein
MLKRSAILLLALIAIAAHAEFEMGVKKGVNLATQYGFDRGALRPELARFFHIGLFADFPVFATLRGEAEIAYTVRGRLDRGAGTVDKLMLENLTAPFALKIRLLDSWIAAAAYAGAEAAFNLGGLRYSGSSASMTTEPLTSAELRLFDVGLLVGTDARVPLGPYLLLLDLRVTVGMLPAVELAGEKPRSVVVSLLFGYGLRL